MSLGILLRDGSRDRTRIGSRTREQYEISIKYLTERRPSGARQAG